MLLYKYLDLSEVYILSATSLILSLIGTTVLNRKSEVEISLDPGYVKILFIIVLIVSLLSSMFTSIEFIKIVVLLTAYLTLGFIMLRLFKLVLKEIDVMLNLLLISGVSASVTLIPIIYYTEPRWRLPALSLLLLLMISILFSVDRDRSKRKHLVRLTLPYSILLFVVVGQCLFVVLLLYPEMFYVGGLDIIRHYSTSFPSLYEYLFHRSFYPFFNLIISLIILFDISHESIQILLAILNIFIVALSAFTMIKSYLNGFDERAKHLSFMIFMLSSGFGWLFFLQRAALDGNLANKLSLLELVRSASWHDVGSGQASWLWLWFRPMSFSFAILFAIFQMILANNKNISAGKDIAFLAFLCVLLGLIHLPELILLNVIAFTGILILGRSPEIKFSELSSALIIASLIILLMNIITSFFLKNILIVGEYALEILVANIILAFINYFLVKSNRVVRFTSELTKRLMSKTCLNLLFDGALIILLAGLAAWLLDPTVFSFSKVATTYYVPTMMYPIILGLPSFLAILGIKSTINSRKIDIKLLFLVISLLATISFGKLISAIVMEIVDIPAAYGEKRFFPLIYIIQSIFASIPLTDTLVNQSASTKKNNILIKTLLSCFIIFISINSTFLTIEYWYSIPKFEKEKVNELLNIIDKHSFKCDAVFALGSYSFLLSDYIPHLYKLTSYRIPLIMAQSYELPLIMLFNRFYPQVCLLSYENEFKRVSCTENFCILDLVSLLPIFANISSKIVLRYTPQASAPVVHSSVSLVTALKPSREELLSALLVSLTKYDYTFDYVNDLPSLSKRKVIILPSDSLPYVNVIHELKDLHDNKTFIVLSYRNDGVLAKQLFEFFNESLTVNKIVIKNIEYTLNKSVRIPLYRAKMGAVTGWYVTEEHEIPFIVEVKIFDHKLFYINLNPFTGNNTSIDENIFLANLLKNYVPLNISLEEKYENWIYTHAAFFSSAEFKGDISISSSSFILDLPEDNSLNIKLVTKDNETLISANSVRIVIDAQETFLIKSDNAKITSGKGFYITIELLNPVLYLINSTVKITRRNGDIYVIKVPKANMLIEGKIYSLLRAPVTFYVNGTSSFMNLYTAWGARSVYKAFNENASFIGLLSFKFMVADKYVFVTDLMIDMKYFKLNFTTLKNVELVLFERMIKFIVMFATVTIIVKLIKYLFSIRNDEKE